MRLSVFFVAAICSLASSVTYADDVTFSGSVFYRERIALPHDASLRVELIDLANPEAVVQRRWRGRTSADRLWPGSRFKQALDGTGLCDTGPHQGRRLHLVQECRADPGRSDKGWGTVSILLVQAGSKGTQEASSVSLAGTEWRVLELDGKRADPNVASTLVFGADGAVSGNGGCNAFRGDVDIEGTTMKFGQLASTMMACEGAKSAQEALFHAALSLTASYSVQDGELTLVDAAGKTVARLGEP